jgi:hypothetical protein
MAVLRSCLDKIIVRHDGLNAEQALTDSSD